MRDNPTQDISALSRDTANSLNELGRIFDKQKIAEQQELAAFGEEAFRLAHNLPDDGSGRKIAVHAIIGGIMSRITGAGFASGVIGAGVNEAIIGEIKMYWISNTTPIQFLCSILRNNGPGRSSLMATGSLQRGGEKEQADKVYPPADEHSSTNNSKDFKRTGKPNSSIDRVDEKERIIARR